MTPAPQNSRRGLKRAVIALLATAWAAHPALSQDSKPSKPAAPAAKGKAQPTPKTAAERAADLKKTGTGTIVMAEETHRLESVGLTFYVPEGSEVKSASAGGEPSYQIMAADSTWWIDIRTPATAKQDITVKDAGEAAMQQLLARVGEQDPTSNTIKTVGQVLDITESLVTDPGRPDLKAYRFYVAMPQVGKKISIVRGYTLFKVAAGRFVAFELTTPEPEFARTRAIYETTVAAARFEDLSQVQTQRALAVKAGMTLLGQLKPEDMKQAVTSRNGRWERLYVPSPTGAEMDAKEIAYRRIQCRPGQRGELDATRPKSKWSAAERQAGYILQIDARYLDGVKRTVDMQSVFFMSEDREEETWTIRQAVREGERAATTTETGARQGKSMTVKSDVPGQAPMIVAPRFESDGYVSQVEAYLLPQLMIGAKLPTQYAFYVFQSRDGKCKLRNDVLEQPADRPGLWRLTTNFADDPQKTRQVSLYNDAGELIRTELPDGKVWEPVEFDRLMKLWRSKDLPLK